MIVCSQLLVEQWHSMINNGTVADALLDRLIHNSHRLELKGESMRRTQIRRVNMVPESYFRHQTLCNDRVFRNTSDRVRLEST